MLSHQHLKREMGEIPMRSRHCNGELPIYATEKEDNIFILGRSRIAMSLSQETCLNLLCRPTGDGEVHVF